MNCSKSRKVLLTACKVFQALIPEGRKRQIISLMVAVVFFGSSAQAQTGDWQAVEKLKPSTRLSLKAQHHILCVFQAATDDELVCRPIRILRLGPAESRFDRQSVREIRLARNQGKDIAIGAGIGGGAGAIACAIKSTDHPGFNAVVGGLSGALVGTVVGAIVSIPLRGKLIYKR